jgi:hypothetical protein
MPVDIVSEKQAAAGQLEGRRVCYLSGPNLTRSAAEAVKAWVQKGGTLWLTAGAAERDEFNRPLHLLDDLLPAERGELKELQKTGSAGRNLRVLAPKDTVKWEGGDLRRRLARLRHRPYRQRHRVLHRVSTGALVHQDRGGCAPGLAGQSRQIERQRRRPHG